MTTVKYLLSCIMQISFRGMLQGAMTFPSFHSALLFVFLRVLCGSVRTTAAFRFVELPVG